MHSRIRLLLFAIFAARSVAAPLSTSPSAPIIIRLESGPTTDGTITDFTALYATQTVDKIKTILGHDATAALVKDETDKADGYWKDLLARSDPSKPANSYARVAAVADLSILNLTSFTAWFSQYAHVGFPNRLLQSNPQHYLMDLNTTSGVLEAIEVSGSGSATHLFSYQKQEIKPFMKDLAKVFDITSQQEATLRDGTYFADAQSGFRQTESGLEAELDLWFPELTDKVMVEAEAEHLSIEIGNWFQFAWQDILDGKVQV